MATTTASTTGSFAEAQIHDSFGRVVDDNVFDQNGAMLADLTRVFEGDAEHVAWTTDINVDERGYPRIAFSVPA